MTDKWVLKAVCTYGDRPVLKNAHSDGDVVYATDGIRFHARQVSAGAKQAKKRLIEQIETVANRKDGVEILINAAYLRDAIDGASMVILRIYPHEELPLEIFTREEGYALIMPVSQHGSSAFEKWRPFVGEEDVANE